MPIMATAHVPRHARLADIDTAEFPILPAVTGCPTWCTVGPGCAPDDDGDRFHQRTLAHLVTPASDYDKEQRQAAIRIESDDINHTRRPASIVLATDWHPAPAVIDMDRVADMDWDSVRLIAAAALSGFDAATSLRLTPEQAYTLGAALLQASTARLGCPMSTHINTVVTLTRAMYDQTGPAWQALHERRHAAVLAAIRAGIDPTLLTAVIESNDEPAKVQAQYALAHAVAAMALDQASGGVR